MVAKKRSGNTGGCFHNLQAAEQVTLRIYYQLLVHFHGFGHDGRTSVGLSLLEDNAGRDCILILAQKVLKPARRC